jgi:hypothetical protein
MNNVCCYIESQRNLELKIEKFYHFRQKNDEAIYYFRHFNALQMKFFGFLRWRTAFVQLLAIAGTLSKSLSYLLTLKNMADHLGRGSDHLRLLPILQENPF